MSRLQEAAELLDGEPETAYAICADILRDEPDEARALYMLGVVHVRAEHHAEALAVFERVAKLSPRKPQVWNALGQALHELFKPAEAREAFKKALELDEQALFLANIGSTYMLDGNPVEAARWCRKALKLDPAHTGATTTLGFAKLAIGDWSGWKDCEAALGGKFRQEVKLGDEARWDGEPVDSLFLYGEQGLGDEIMYASIVQEAAARAKRTVLECDERLHGLFSRSFPGIEVHGTRRKDKPWLDGSFNAGCALGSLPAIFRHDAAACPKTPYLTADHERRVQWRALFDSWGKKPKIGLCWSGGRHSTHKKARQVGLEAFRELIWRSDAHWVSLQYQDATDEIQEAGLPMVRHFRRATQTPDYDDTAAMVAECDLVIGPHTTVHHLAGALGVPSVVLVPSRTLWAYQSGDRIAWYENQIYHRQKPGESWADCIKRLDLDSHLHRV